MTSDHLSVLNMFKTSWLKFYRCMCVCAPVMVARMRPALLLRAQICPSKGRKNFHFYTGNMAGQNWPQQPDRARNERATVAWTRWRMEHSPEFDFCHN